MKNSLKTGLLALVAVSALSAPLVYAGQHKHGGSDGYHSMEMRGHKGGMMKMFKRLDLTDQQKTDIKALITAHKEAMQETRPTDEERLAKRTEMKELITAASFDESRALEIIATKQVKHQQSMVERMKLQNTIYNMLTAEQKAELNEKMEEFAERKKNRRDGW